MSNIWKRSLSMVLAVFMVISMLPNGVFATNTDNSSTTTGTTNESQTNTGSTESGSSNEETAADLEIGTAAQLQDFAVAITGGNNYVGKVVRLVNDIDLAGIEWAPIGGWNGAVQFLGEFDGNGKTISNLTIDDTNVTAAKYRSGLFADLGQGSSVHDLTLKNVRITNTKGGQAGALAGRSGASLKNVCVEGFKANAASGAYVGAAAGITNYYEAGDYGFAWDNVDAKDVTIAFTGSRTSYGGGLLGGMNPNGARLNTYENCDVTNVTITDENIGWHGGMWGWHGRDSAFNYVKKCSVTNVNITTSGTGESRVGGICGFVGVSGGLFENVTVNGGTLNAGGGFAGGFTPWSYAWGQDTYQNCSVKNVDVTCTTGVAGGFIAAAGAGNQTSKCIDCAVVGGTVTGRIASGFAGIDRHGNAGGAFILSGCKSSAIVTGTEYAAGLIARAKSSYQTVVVGSEFNGTVSGEGYVCEGVITTHTDKTLLAVSGVPVLYQNIKDENGNPIKETSDAAYVAMVSGKAYATLKDAVAAANAVDGGATVIMLSDVTLGEKLTISGNVTISGACTITRADTYTGTLFTVNAGATLTLDGGLTIDGGNNYKFDRDAYDADAADWNTSIAKENSAKWFTPEEGAPVATAYMITLDKGTSAEAFGGTVNLNDVTIQNNYSTNIGIVNAAQYTETNLNGAKITHVAATQSSGVVVRASGAGIKVNMNEGTIIDGNHVGGNHGIFMIYSGTVFTMNGGEITNNTGWNSNGVAVGVYWATFNMKGGKICSNTGVYGPSNGRNAAIYLHSGHTFEMTGGTICCNSGRSRGGIDAPYDNGTAIIKGGEVLDNISRSGNDTADVLGTSAMQITGGTFTQDVSKWLAPDTGLVYDEATGTYSTTDHVYNLWFRDPVTGEQLPYVGPLQGNDPASLVATGKSFYANYYVMELEVLSNAKIDETIVIDYPMTVNLNGHTLTTVKTAAGEYMDAFTILADVTVIGNGTVDARPSHGYSFYIGTKDDTVDGNLTIENGTFYGESSVAQVSSGSLTVNGGMFAVSLEKETDTYDFVLNCWDANYKNGTAKIVVKGGTFKGFNPADNEAELGDHTNFCADGYLAEELEEGVYGVRVDKDALDAIVTITFTNGDNEVILKYPSERFDTIQKLIGTNNYADFVLGATQNELLAAIANGTASNIVMTLHDDIELDAPINFYNKYFQIAAEYDLTVNGNGHSITWADGYTGTLINVESGVSVELNNLTIDGENAFTFYNDTTTVENGQNWYTRFVNVGEDKAVNANVIVNAGNLTLDHVTIMDVTIASDSGNGKTSNTETGYALMYNDDLAIIKSNGGMVTMDRASITGNAGMVLNAVNAETVIGNSVIDGNMGCGNKGGIIIADGGTMELNNASVCGNKAMARSATVLGVINGAVVTMNGNTKIDNNKHIGVGSNTSGSIVGLEGASQFVMNGGSISNNVGGRAGAIASRWSAAEALIDLNAGTITGNSASNDSWNGASIFLRSPATIGDGMKVDGTIAVNAAPGDLDITGGTFTNFELIVTDGLSAEITGGTFDNDPSEWLAEGYVAPKNDEGLYGVEDLIAEIIFTGFGGGETSITYPGYADSLQELVDYYMFCNNANETAIPGFSFGDYTPVLNIVGDLDANDIAYLGSASAEYTSKQPMNWTVKLANADDAANIKSADGYVVLRNDDGTLTVTKILASITFEFLGTTEYYTYPGYHDGDEPINSMHDLIDTYLTHIMDRFGMYPEDPTITLHSDIALDETFVIDAQMPLGGEYDYDLTFDLNGYTITSTATPAIRIVDDLDVTVKNGTMDTESYCFILGASDGSSAGNLTIESGTYTGVTTVVSVTKGTLTINGGSFATNGDEYGATYLLNCVDANAKDGSAKIVVKGGTFKGFNPADNAAENPKINFCADGYISEEIDNGVFGVRAANYVAEVNGVKYESLKEAIDACTNGETVKLLTDLVFDADDIVNAIGGPTGYGQWSNPCIIYVGGTKGATDAENKPSNVNAILDLNGHSITNNAEAYLFLIMDNAKLTIKDSGNGAGIIGNSEAPVIWSTGTETVVTIESGKYSIGNYGSLMWATHSGDLVIKGGEFSTTAADASSLILRNEEDRQNSKFFISGKSKVVVTGGTFVGFNPEEMLDDSKTPAYKFNAVPVEYKAAKDNNVYTVIPYVQWVKAELLAGRNVTLDRDVVVDGSMIESIPASTNGNGKYPNYGIFNVVGDYDVTFDLNGHTITYNGHKEFQWNGKTYNSCTVAHGLFFANAGADLTVTDTSAAKTGTVMVYGLASGAYVASPDTTFTIEGGTWINNRCQECGGTNIFLYPLQGGELYIKGGHFAQALDASGESYLIVEHGGEYKNSVIDYSKTKVEITGGTFVGMDPNEIKYFQQTSGNNLDTTSKPTTNGCADNYESVKNDDGSYGVIPTKLVKVEVEIMPGAWGTSYITVENWADLEAALGQYTNVPVKITLLDDVKLSNYLTITGNKTVEINLNGKNITRDGGTCLYINGEGVTVTINGEGTVSGRESVYINAGKAVINGGTYNAEGHAVYVINKGHAEINGGTFSSTDNDFVLNEYDKTRGDTTITVKGGTFAGFNPENNAAEGKNTNFCADSYIAEELTAGQWTVRKFNPVAQIGETQYESLMRAIAAVKNGETIVLLTDIDENVTIKQTADLSFTIDGNGKTYTGTIAINGNKISGDQGQGLTIKNVKFVATEEGQACVSVPTKNTFARNITVDGCTFTGTGAAEYATYGIYLRHAYNITVKNTTGTKLYDLVYGNTSVTGITVESVTVTDSVNGIWLSYVNSTATFKNLNLDVTETGVGIRNNANGTATFENCTIKADVPVYLDENTNIAYGFALTFDGTNTMTSTSVDGNWLVVTERNGEPFDANFKVVMNDTGLDMTKTSGLVAKIGNVYYNTLKYAIEDAKTGNTIELLVDLTLDTSKTVNNSDGYAAIFNVADKAITIDLNGHDIAVNASAADLADEKGKMLLGVFAVDSNGKLTLKDSVDTSEVKVTANDAYVYTLAIAYDGLLNIESGYYYTDKMDNGRGMIYGYVGDHANADGSNMDKGVNVYGGTFILGNVGDPTMQNGSPWIFNTSGNNTGKYIYVAGGTFNADVNHQYWAHEVKLADGKAVKYIGNDLWTVVDAVAYIIENNHGYDRVVAYATLQEAIDAIADSVDDTVYFLTDIDEDVKIEQTADQNFVIDGKDFKYSGTMTVNGNNRSAGAETLTIKNVNFFASDTQKSIVTVSGTFAHNITVVDSTFTGSDNAGYGMQLQNAYNIKLQNVTGTDLFELVYANKAVTGFTAENVIVTDTTYGFWLPYVINASFRNVKIDAVDAGVYICNRNASSATFEDCAITALYPVRLDQKSVTNDYTLIFNGTNTMTSTDAEGYWLSVVGTDAMLKVVMNDANLDMNKTYGLVARIDNVYYNTLANAIVDAKTDDTIVIVKDHELDGSKVVHENTLSYDTLLLVEGKKITIDFNGKTVKVTPTFTATGDEGVEGGIESVIFVGKGANLTLKDSTGNGGITVNKGTPLYSLIYNSESTLSIESGHYYVEELLEAGSLIYGEAKNDTSVRGGYFTLGNASEYTESTKPWIFNVLGKNEGDFIKITGGYFNQNPYMNRGTAKDCEVKIPATMAFVKVTLDGYYEEEYFTLANAVAMNVEKELGYTTLVDAFNDAVSGQTVILLVDLNEGMMQMVPAGVTFNLNGHYLTTKNIFSFGNVIDKVVFEGDLADNGVDVEFIDNGIDGVGGIVISNDRTKAFVQLQQTNKYLPIYDTANGCYRFFGYEFVSKGVKAVGTDDYKYGVALKFSNIEAFKLLSETENSGLSISMSLTWDDAAAPMVYTFSESTIKTFAKNAYAKYSDPNYTGTRALTLTVYGTGNLGEGTIVYATPELESITGVTTSSEAIGSDKAE